MLGKDSVQGRLGAGLSFTEFSYMLLQAADFRHLYRTYGVELQTGGADQWGNITAGLELIRRVEAPGGGESPAHGIAYPLFTDPSGAKFGKTAEGTSVWLDPALTSPYEFYQYWLATEDADVGHRLRFFTLMEQEQILGLSAETEEAPELRSAQRALAYDVTRRVHGQEQADRVVAASEAAFASEPIVDPATLAAIHESAGGFEFTDQQRRAGSLAFVVDTGLVASRGEARRLIAGGGLTIGTVRVASQDDPVPEPIAGKWLVVRIGKRRLAVGRRQD
jgi:tyrosyl-tRNA synthetase